MSQEPKQQASQEAEIISLSDRMRSNVDLERAFQGAQARLIQFLTYRLGSEAEAQDTAQLVFLKLWERRESLKNDNLTSLIFMTARNLAWDILRSRRAGRLALLDSSADEDSVQDDAPSAERILIGRNDLKRVHEIIDELPQKCRRAFLAYQFEGLAYREVAARMNLTESMVRKYVRRAMTYCTARYTMLEGWE